MRELCWREKVKQIVLQVVEMLCVEKEKIVQGTLLSVRCERTVQGLMRSVRSVLSVLSVTQLSVRCERERCVCVCWG